MVVGETQKTETEIEDAIKTEEENIRAVHAFPANNKLRLDCISTASVCAQRE